MMLRSISPLFGLSHLSESLARPRHLFGNLATDLLADGLEKLLHEPVRLLLAHSRVEVVSPFPNGGIPLDRVRPAQPGRRLCEDVVL